MQAVLESDLEREELLKEMELMEMVKALLEGESLLMVENANEIVALDEVTFLSSLNIILSEKMIINLEF